MNPPPLIQPRLFHGTFIIWEPNPEAKATTTHRRYDSDSIATTFGRHGQIIIDANSIRLHKDRTGVQCLILLALIPAALFVAGFLWYLAEQFIPDPKQYEGLILLCFGGFSILIIGGCIKLVTAKVKGIFKSFSLSQIANVRMKQVRVIKNHASVQSGAVDFTIIPAELANQAPGYKGSPPPIPVGASAEKCTFVTIVPERGDESSILSQMLPATLLPLVGTLHPDIPPQSAAMKLPGSDDRLSGATQELRSNSHVKSATGRRFQHDYTWSVGNFIWALLFGGVAAGCCYVAATNNRGLILWHLIEFGPTGATVFYWLIAIFLSALFLFLLIWQVQLIFNPHSLMLNESGITFNESWMRLKQDRLEFAEVRSISERQSVRGGSRTLQLATSRRTYEIEESKLPASPAYDEILAAIKRALTASQEKGS